MTDLDARYGRRSGGRPAWFWPVFAAIGVSIGIAWAAWSAWSDVPSFQAKVFAYEVVDERTTTVSLDVYRDESIALDCHVYAQAEDKSIVGETSIDGPASGTLDLRVTTEITTERRAVTARLRDCKPA